VFLLPKDFICSPEASSKPYLTSDAEAYTRWLATHHYENFHVATFLLPKRLHQDFYNVYSFCRWADDLGDEFDDSAESLRLLGWWGEQLQIMSEGRATHPVFIALRGTVERRRLPIEPFRNLIQAFIQDQSVKRYETYAQLLDYCRYSANPVGRLVLYLFGYSDEERQKLSDATCTALQLANFWQDVAVDLGKGRVYLPLEALKHHGCPLEDVLARRATPAFRETMKEAVEVARGLFHQGLPLCRMVDRRLAVDLELFSRGGLRILGKIEEQDYNVFERRPSISRTERFWLLLSTLTRVVFSKAA
jgi:squalene synthase HpnC